MKIELNDNTAATLAKAESLLFNGNGFIGVRGNLEEWPYDFYTSTRETYINGFYEKIPVNYPEKMYGFTDTADTMISVIDGQTSIIKIGNETFRIDQGTVLQNKRFVDLDAGITVREIRWQSPTGKITTIKITRLTSFVHKNLFATQITFQREHHQEPITVETHLNFAPPTSISDQNDPRLNHNKSTIQIENVDLSDQCCRFGTKNSHLQAELKWQLSDVVNTKQEDNRIVITSEVKEGCFEKRLSYAFKEYHHDALALSFQQLLEEQHDYLADFWRTTKITISSQDQLEESINYSSYALLQSLGTDTTTSIAAKGLSGSGYEGHYFWDTEMYIFPFFLYMQPDLAKKILLFRYQTLTKAKENRALLGYQTGALYPWRTITGSESSAFFEAGSAQHHINADIAFAFISYYQNTGDLDFIRDYGFEVLLETARVFAEIGYIKAGKFHIDEVTGPDEYTVLVNDNYYTNRMVQHQFAWVNRLAKQLAQEQPAAWQQLVERLQIAPDEIEKMAQFGQLINKPFNKELGIIAQDRDFLQKAPWPYSKAETKYPLLLNYHPLTIYRYQITKQADAVLALMLYPHEQPEPIVTASTKYYDQITTHDSTLSYSAYSIVYARLGQTEKAYDYFQKNARIDLDDSHHNTKDGIHTASMGGTFMTILFGFCGLEINGQHLTVQPHLPKAITKLSFQIHFQQRQYQIDVDHQHAELKLISN
ncbi:glycoside hydrolase family 65 protein [Lapidilactobacillus wuchangensis]|uniref:glycoside hydrolase family 65 protein n=1 Tax=Lapidilactobacillus wuchangensis TaxID=2486001 RepID=UPI0013DDCD90|nr:glycoside hydrolase family 65 protein [Lapidilactobacillus wuchangensis]